MNKAKASYQTSKTLFRKLRRTQKDATLITFSSTFSYKVNYYKLNKILSIFC